MKEIGVFDEIYVFKNPTLFNKIYVSMCYYSTMMSFVRNAPICIATDEDNGIFSCSVSLLFLPFQFCQINFAELFGADDTNHYCIGDLCIRTQICSKDNGSFTMQYYAVYGRFLYTN